MASRFRSTFLIGCIALTVLCRSIASQASPEDDSGAYEELTGTSLADLPGLRNLEMRLGGWASMGVTYNGNNPSDHSNAPVTFNDRASEFQLNQFDLFLQRPVNEEAKRWDIGGRLDFLFGTDSRFTQAAGNWDQGLISSGDLRFYDIALPQAYADIATPFARGATVRIGHFYTIIGVESIPSPNNFFYSHSYTMQYGEPFTHTGALLRYPLRENLTVSAGAVTGPHGKMDNFDKHLGNWNFLGGATWLSDDAATSFALALTSGPTDDKTGDNRTIASLVLNHDLTGKLHYIIQHDQGFQANAVAGRNAQWYGLNQYLIYALTDTVSLGLRAEWFRDNAGFRVFQTPASYYEVTAGVNWKPQAWLLLRVEGRNDWADARQKLLDSGTRDHQFTLGANAVITF